MSTLLRILTPGPGNVLPIEGGRFFISTLSAAQTIYVPPNASSGMSWFIYDLDFNAVANPITIKGMFGELINQAATVVINTNGGSVEIFRSDNGIFRAVFGSSSSGGGGGGGVGAVMTGAADPPVAAPSDPSAAALYYPTGGGTTYQWEVASQAWV